MSRASRPFPLWILLGAAVAILGAALVANSTRTAPVAHVEQATAPNEAVASPATASPSSNAIESESAPVLPMLPKPRPALANSAPPAGTAGMVVGIHPESGRPGMPTPEQREQIRIQEQNALQSPGLDRSMEGLQVVHKPDGSRMIDLQDRFQEYTVVRIASDGKKDQVCVQGPDVEAALKGKAEPAKTTANPER